MNRFPIYCPCGSGKPFIGTEHDGYNIYMFHYCCDECYDHQRKKFRDDIFTHYDTEGVPVDDDY